MSLLKYDFEVCDPRNNCLQNWLDTCKLCHQYNDRHSYKDTYTVQLLGSQNQKSSDQLHLKTRANLLDTNICVLLEWSSKDENIEQMHKDWKLQNKKKQIDEIVMHFKFNIE